MKKVLLVIGSLLVGLSLNSQVLARTVELEPIVVTPWRGEEEFSDVSRNVTVISSEDINSSSAKFLPDLIQQKSGVVVSNYFGNPKGTVVDIRGFGESSLSNILVLVDGRRTNQVDLSGADWAQIDLNSIDRIEIVRGPSTVLYGDNATAGVINIITKKGKSEKPTITLSGEFGSYQYHKSYVNLSGAINKSKNSVEGRGLIGSTSLDYFLSFSEQDTTGYRANNDYWATDYFASLQLRPIDIFEIAFTGGYHRDHYGMPGALYLDGNPNAATPIGIDDIGRRGTVYPDDVGSTSDYFITSKPRLIFFFGDNEITASFFGSFRRRASKGLNVPEADVWATPHSEYETTHHIDSIDFRPKITTSILWRGIDNKLTLGLDYFQAKDQVLSGNRIGNQQDETDIYKETLGIYAHDNIKLNKKILLNAGIRSEWADYTFVQKRIVRNHDTKKLKEAAFNFGGGFKYNDSSQVYADISRSYRFPNTEEYYQNKYFFWGTEYGGLNTDIKHQQATNYEIGVKDFSFDWLDLNADLFFMDVKSEIYYDPSQFLNTNYRPKTRHYGLEVEADFSFFDGKIKPFLNWVLQESFFKGGTYAGNQVPFVPKNKVSAGITLSPIDKLNWTTSLNYVGSRFRISDQNNIASKLKSYATLDTKFDYTFKNMNVWGAVKNILDKEYYAYGVTNSTATAETFYPAPEMRLEAGMSVKF